MSLDVHRVDLYTDTYRYYRDRKWTSIGNDVYCGRGMTNESPCGNEENRTHRLNCSARNTDTSEKVDYCKADRVSKSIR